MRLIIRNGNSKFWLHVYIIGFSYYNTLLFVSMSRASSVSETMNETLAYSERSGIQFHWRWSQMSTIMHQTYDQQAGFYATVTSGVKRQPIVDRTVKIYNCAWFVICKKAKKLVSKFLRKLIPATLNILISWEKFI